MGEEIKHYMKSSLKRKTLDGVGLLILLVACAINYIFNVDIPSRLQYLISSVAICMFIYSNVLDIQHSKERNSFIGISYITLAFFTFLLAKSLIGIIRG